MLCDDMPNPFRGGAIRAYHLVKTLSKDYGYDITLISFVDKHADPRRYSQDLTAYCRVITPIQIDNKMSLPRALLYTLKNCLSFRNILSDHTSRFDSFYSPRMDAIIQEELRSGKYDAIYAQGLVAHYVVNSGLPKIVEPLDAVSYSWQQSYRKQKNPFRRLIHMLMYRKAIDRERTYFPRFDYCVVVTEFDKQILVQNARLSNVLVIPMGTDVSFFAPMSLKEEFPSLVYVGAMNTPKNANTILDFCNNVFPAISDSVRGVKLYVVGGDPSPDVIRLGGPSIVVTGFVDDVRPYLAKCSVFIVPMTEGTGIKSKVLEAMAMAKPVVTTPVGILGIDARNGEEVAVVEGRAEFADMVVKLLRDTGMRSRMGNNARKLIEREYSWEHTAAAICRCYEELIRKASSDVSDSIT